jgi:protein-L-isoaspartate(D-aspartate) O-methyltransferase
MLFPWKKNRIKKLFRLNRNNEALIEELKIEGITENNVLYAIKKVPREIFVERQFIQQAYENIPLPIDCEQTISQPFVVAYMIACLNLKKTDKVLEIGTGSGFQTAILGHLCQEVCTIEIHGKLINKAKKRIEKLNLKNIIFKLGNGAEGWQNKALFDAIIISAASEIIPAKLLENLKNQGSLVMPKKKPSGNQKLLLVKKNNETYLEKELLDVKFVPLLNKNIE